MTPPIGAARAGLRSVVDAIPDSAIHQWKFGEGSGDTLADSISSADATRVGPTWVSGTYVDGYALDGDATDDYNDHATLGTFGSILDTDITIAFTIEGTDDSARLFGEGPNSGGTNQIQVNIGEFDAPTGELNLFLRDDDGNDLSEVTTDASVTDGNKHRVVVVKTGNSAGGVQIYQDTTALSMSNQRDQGFSNVSDFTDGLFSLAVNDGGVQGPYGGIMDNLIIADDSWSSSEIQDDYDQQPWT